MLNAPERLSNLPAASQSAQSNSSKTRRAESRQKLANLPKLDENDAGFDRELSMGSRSKRKSRGTTMQNYLS